MPALTMLSRRVEVVAGLQLGQQVLRDVVADLPLAEDTHDREVALQAAHEQLLALDLERHVTVGVDVGLETLVQEDVQDPSAQGVLAGRRREVGQGGGIAHGHNVATAYAGGHAPAAVTCHRRSARPCAATASTSPSTPATPTGSRSACSTRVPPRARRVARCGSRSAPTARGSASCPASARASATACGCTVRGTRRGAAAQPRQAAARPVRPGRRGRRDLATRGVRAQGRTTSLRGDPDVRDGRDSARRTCPAASSSTDGFDWGDDVAPAGAVDRDGDLRGARREPDPPAPGRARGAARDVRRPGAPGRPRAPARTSASPPSSCCRCRPSPPSRPWSSGAWPTTGATTPSASSPRTRRTPPPPARRRVLDEFKGMVRLLHARGPRGHPRRRLQPHLPSRAATARRCPGAVWTTGPTTASTSAVSDIDVTGCGNTLDLRHPRGLPDGPGLAALLGRRVPRRRVPVRPRGGPRRAAATTATTRTTRSWWRCAPTRSCPGSSSSPSRGTSACTAGAPASSRRRSRSGTTASATASATFWLPDVARSAHGQPGHGVRELATRLAGSQDLFGARDRGPIASVNYVAAHDGFTLADTTAYERKHNERQRRGQPRRPRRQPVVEPRRRGRQRRRPDVAARPPPVAAQPARHPAAVHRRADDQRRRRARPHPAGQQQRLLPGQRDVLAGLGAATVAAATCSTTTRHLAAAARRRTPVLRQRATSSPAGPVPRTARTDLTWFAADGAARWTTAGGTTRAPDAADVPATAAVGRSRPRCSSSCTATPRTRR